MGRGLEGQRLRNSIFPERRFWMLHTSRTSCKHFPLEKKKYKHTRLGYIWKGWKAWKHQPYIGFCFYPHKKDKKDMVRVRLTIEEVTDE